MRQHPTIHGYDAYKLGDIIKNMRVAHGVSLEKLSTLTGIAGPELQALQQGKTLVPHAQVQVDKIWQALGYSSFEQFMDQGRATPMLSKPAVADAIRNLAKIDRMDFAAVAGDSGATAQQAENFAMKKDLSLSLDSLLQIAQKSFGEENIGTMVRRSQSLQKQAGIARSEWVQRVKHARQSVPAEAETPMPRPAVTSLSPEETNYRKQGAAVLRLRLSKGMLNRELADAVHLHISTITAFERGDHSVSPDKMDRIAEAVGVKDSGRLIEAAEALPEITHATVAEAIYRAIKRERYHSPNELGKDAGLPRNGHFARFVQNRTANRPLAHSPSIESMLPVAKKIGYDSIGEFLLGEGLSPAPLTLEHPRRRHSNKRETGAEQSRGH